MARFQGRERGRENPHIGSIKKKIVYDPSISVYGVTRDLRIPDNVDKLRYRLYRLWPSRTNGMEEPTFVTPGYDLTGEGDLVGQKAFGSGMPMLEIEDPVIENGPDWEGGFPEIRQNFSLRITPDVVEAMGFEAAFDHPGENLIEMLRDADDPQADVILKAFMFGYFGLAEFEDPLFIDQDPRPWDKEYYDDIHELPLFLHKAEALFGGLLNNPQIASVTPRYNYTLLDYEKVLEGFGNRSLINNIIPNMYALLLESQNLDIDTEIGERPTNLELLAHTSLFGFLPTNIVRPEVILNQGHPDGIERVPGQYFCEWTKALSRAREDPNIGPILRGVVRSWLPRFGNLIVPASNVKLINEFDEYRNIFPMYIDVQFPTFSKKAFAKFFKESELSSYLMFEFAISDKVEVAVGGPGEGAEGEERVANLRRFGEQLDPEIHPQLLQKKRYVKQIKSPFRGWSSDLSSAAAFEHEEFAATSTGVHTLDLLEWWKYFDDPDVEKDFEKAETSLLDNNYSIILGSNDENEVLVSNLPEYRFYRNLLKIRFRNKLKRIIRSHLRSFKDMLNGEKAYSETVFYIIEKQELQRREKPGAGENISAGNIQNIYVPNLQEAIRYVDTQVKYARNSNSGLGKWPPDNEYRYIIHAVQMVIGSRYKYEIMDYSFMESHLFFRGENRAPGAPEHGHLEDHIKVNCTATIKPLVTLVKNTVFDSSKSLDVLSGGLFWSVFILDKPPMPPNIDIVPYKGIDDKILINLEAQSGQQYLPPIAIEDTDFDRIQDIRKSQWLDGTTLDAIISGENTLEDLEFANQYLLFGNDDPIKAFEIFRTEEKPSSYFDFKGKLRVTNVVRGRFGELDVNSTSLRDDVKPNKKYYYTFRTIDIHNHVSNPSPIYEVEMVNNNGAIYPLIRLLDLNEILTTTKKATSSFKKYIKIFPNLAHTLINQRASQLIGDNGNLVESPRGRIIKLGGEWDDNPVIWGKRFKVRFISKKTGRKFDLNLGFNTEQNDLIEQEEEMRERKNC
ncbi:hypothetical protein CL634_01450 [bacterium]|nr:hypothetical protein [bacterium]